MLLSPPDDTEHVDVGVVDGEVDEDGARAAVEPRVALQLVDDVTRLLVVDAEVLREAAAVVAVDDAAVLRAVQLTLTPVAPPGDWCTKVNHVSSSTT